MKIVTNIADMQTLSDSLKRQGLSIGCVPTMGYLHEGHLSLLDFAKNVADITVVTLFVNPSQFAPNEDLAKYPRDISRDIQLLEARGCDFLFAPDKESIYPPDYSTFINVNNVTEKFEGEFRPEHFGGVATIVAKLFNIVKPDSAVFGQKDYQQTIVIKRMVVDLNLPVNIIVAPTIREADGLAMSSRNIYLSETDRQKALIISRALFAAEHLIKNGERNRNMINDNLTNTLKTVDELQIDYACSALADNLDEPDIFADGDSIVLLIAVRLGTTRLIDNLIINL